MKCPNCGEENPEGMKFCGNCGTKLPEPKNHCPHCNKDWPITMKFCGECGFKFDGNGAAKSAGISMGDKNVIAGDVIGSKDETHVSGNATIIKNEDESKKIAKCHICGRIILRIEGYDCTECGQFTCNNCYITEFAKCKNCHVNSKNQKEEVYKQTLRQILADGKIDIEERTQLISLQQQLGISQTRAIELENLIKAETKNKNTNQLGSFDKISYESAKTELYDELKYKDALEKLESLYNKYPENEEILTDYLSALAIMYPQRAKEFINSIHADVLCLYLTQIDLASLEKNYSIVEELIEKAEKLWTDEVLLNCRKAEFNLKLAEASGNSNYLANAKKIIGKYDEVTNKLEKSWLIKVKRDISTAENISLPQITDEYCQSQNVYKGFFVPLAEKIKNISLEGLLLLDKSCNDSNIKNRIGELYYNGTECPENIPQAVEYFTNSANMGNINAQNNLIKHYYDNGIAENQDYTKVFELANKVSATGNIFAYKILGDMYYDGKGIPQDYNKAFEYYLKAAEYGNAIAQNSLGDMYCDGKGVEQNYEKAFEWFTKSAEQDYAWAQKNLGIMYKEGLGVQKDCSKAFEWYLKAAEQGNAKAQNQIGMMYYQGNAVEKDEKKAESWLTKSAEQGDSDGCFLLGGLLHSNADYNKAINWLTKSAEQNNRKAFGLLGQIYYQGYGIEKDYTKAFTYMKKAAEMGDVVSMRSLGVIYSDGEAVPKDEATACEWYLKAAEKGDATAQFYIAEAYGLGKGVEKDLTKSYEWATKAYENGYTKAKDLVDEIQRRFDHENKMKELKNWNK